MSSAKEASAGVEHRSGLFDRISRSPIGERCRWLGRPWFFAAVALLAMNDQAFKGAWPGWVTGKLSDFAGLVVVATLVSVLVGGPRGLALAGVGFLALKTVPGVAELVSPLLGGTTLRDPYDLLALLVLPPLYRVLRRRRRDQATRSRRGWQLVGLVAAVAATSATSAVYEDFVDWVVFDGGGVLALVRLDNYQTPVYLRSRDNGQTWVEEAKYIVRDPEPPYAFGEVCSSEGVCYRDNKMDSRVLERREIGAKTWRAVAIFDLSVGGIYVDPIDGDRVALVQRMEEVVVRTPVGTWQRTNLVALARQLRPKPDPWAGPRSVALVSGGLVLVGGFFIALGIGAERLRNRRRARESQASADNKTPGA